jgi:acyl carrier protein
MDDIAPRIIELIAKSKAIPPETITRESNFDDLNIDSLDKINLTFDVEEMFSIVIPDAALNDLRTVGDVVDGVKRLLAEKQQQGAPVESSTL